LFNPIIISRIKQTGKINEKKIINRIILFEESLLWIFIWGTIWRVFINTCCDGGSVTVSLYALYDIVEFLLCLAKFLNWSSDWRSFIYKGCQVNGLVPCWKIHLVVGSLS